MNTPGRIVSVLASCVLFLSTLARSQVCVPEFDELPGFQVGANAGANALVDLDADGDLDLLTGLSCFFGDGTGRFETHFRLPATPQVPEGFDIRAADFDQDGHIDLAMVMIGGPHINFFYGRGPSEDPAALFERPKAIAIDRTVQGVWHMETTDLNGDDLTDIVAISIMNSNLLILVNQGERRFRLSRHTLQGRGGGNHMLATGDFDGDGRADVAAGAGGQFSMLFGDGTGGFELQRDGRLSDFGHRFRAGDLDGDGRSDLCATAGDTVQVFLGKDIDREGLPRDASYDLQVGAGVGVRFLEVTDINSDGALDITAVAEAGPRSRYRTFLGTTSNGQLSFVPGEPKQTTLSGHGSVLAVGDVDGDQSPDIVITTEDSGRGQVFLNTALCVRRAERGDANGDGSFNVGDAIAVAGYLFDGDAIACVPAGEVNGDGAVNLADVVSILNHLFSSGPPPVDPGPVSCF